MMRDERSDEVGFLGSGLGERARDRRMGLRAPLGELRVIGDFLRQRMLECVDGLGKERLLVDELRGDQPVEEPSTSSALFPVTCARPAARIPCR